MLTILRSDYQLAFYNCTMNCRACAQVVIHVEPRGYNYNSLFCEEEEAKLLAFDILLELVSDEFCGGDRTCSSSDSKVVLPSLVRGNHSTMRAALLAGSWPTVGSMLGKFVFNLNLFSSNAACRQVYYNEWGGAKIFFDRAAGDSVNTDSLYSAFMESKYPSASLATTGFIIRRRFWFGEIEPIHTIAVRNASFPANIFNYDFYETLIS